MERLRDGLGQTDGSWPGLRLEPLSAPMRSWARGGTIPPSVSSQIHRHCPGSEAAFPAPLLTPRPAQAQDGPGLQQTGGPAAPVGSREGTTEEFPKTDTRAGSPSPDPDAPQREPHLDSSGARVADGALGARGTLQPRETPLAPLGGCSGHPETPPALTPRLGLRTHCRRSGGALAQSLHGPRLCLSRSAAPTPPCETEGG